MISFYDTPTDAWRWEPFFCPKPMDDEIWETAVRPHLTVGALADFIEQHIPKLHTTPIAPLGVPCQTATTFKNLETFMQHHQPTKSRFAPSTSLFGHLDGCEIRNIWSNLNRVFPGMAPPLCNNTPDKVHRVLMSGCAIVLSGLIGAGLTYWLIPVNQVCFSVAGFLTFLVAYCWIVSLKLDRWQAVDNPLPTGITTYGDLAKAMTKAAIDGPGDGD